MTDTGESEASVTCESGSSHGNGLGRRGGRPERPECLFRGFRWLRVPGSITLLDARPGRCYRVGSILFDLARDALMDCGIREGTLLGVRERTPELVDVRKEDGSTTAVRGEHGIFVPLLEVRDP